MIEKELEQPNVTSSEPGKVRFVDRNGLLVTIKKTDEAEFENFQQMADRLSSCRAIPWKGKSIVVETPRIISWNPEQGLLETELFSGQNLETLLKTEDSAQRTALVEFCRQFVLWMKEIGTVWGDCAPRNIMIDEESQTVCIVDFEKGLILQDRQFDKPIFDRYTRGIIFEEMAAFLLPSEQQVVFGDIWTDDSDFVPASYLMGKREQILYARLYGEAKSEISVQDAMVIQKTMASVVTPYVVGEKLFFPLIYLGQASGPTEYVNLLTELLTIDKNQWPDFLRSKFSLDTC